MDEMREVQKACDGRLKRQKCKPHAANIICCFKFNVYHVAQLLGPEIILVRGCENVAGKLRQKW